MSQISGSGSSDYSNVPKGIDIGFTEMRFYEQNGFSMKTYRFANFLVHSAPDGAGLIIFDNDRADGRWAFRKEGSSMAMMASPKYLCQGIDELMLSGTNRILSLLTGEFVPTANLFRDKITISIYNINGTEITPATPEEVEDIKAATELPEDKPHTLIYKQATPWVYDPMLPFTQKPL